MILLAICFLASGGMLITVGDFAGIHKTTAGKHIWKVLQAIAKLKTTFLMFPNDPMIIQNIKKDFYSISKFPKVVGALDCTHVKIQSPGMYLHKYITINSSYKLRILCFVGGLNAEIYRNRKQFFSINVQAICDSHLKFLDVVSRWQGSAHDSRIFQHSKIYSRFQNGEFGDSILLGDSGYPPV